MAYIAKKYCLSKGVGISDERLPSFDKALLDAGVGNYNLVRLSSILPANCERVRVEDIKDHIKEGSLLPTAYSTVSSGRVGEEISSAIAIGFPVNKDDVGVIMEFSSAGVDEEEAVDAVCEMVKEAFKARGWALDTIECASSHAVVEEGGATFTTFACVAEW